MKKFIEFLEANNAWENFEREFTEQGGSVKAYKEICKESRNRELDAAFMWTHTKEGHAYWSKLNRKWREEDKTLEEKLLSDD